MAVISLSIEESSEQILAGFPRTVSVYANIPSTIFYTLDGEDPTTSSSVYVSPISIPTNFPQITFKVFATNGTDTSAIITKEYTSDILNNTRLPHSPTTNIGASTQSNYPFGSTIQKSDVYYLNPAQAGTTVTNPALPIIPLGYDADGNPVGTNKPIDQYLNIYSTTDSQGKEFHGVGTLPSNSKTIGRQYPSEYSPEESSRSDRLFNPKAMVIFQDSTTEDPTNPPMINRQYFSGDNLEVVKNGANLKVSALDSLGVSGSFIKSYYNPRTEMMTSYYRDSATNKWIISSYPYQPRSPDQNNLSGMVAMKGGNTIGKVFSWHLWQYRTLI